MYYFAKLCILLSFILSPILAFDNEIFIKGEVIEGVTVDILSLSESKDNIYLFSNSKTGIKVRVKELGDQNNKGINKILNNGVVYPLPAVYRVYKSSCFLGTSGFCIGDIVLGIDISVQ